MRETQEITRRPAELRKVRVVREGGIKGSTRHTAGEINYLLTRIWRTQKGGTQSNECAGYLKVGTWLYDL